MLSRTIPILAATALLAACNSASEEPSSEPQQAEAAQPVPVLTPAPTPTAAADGTALVEGAWTVAEGIDGARAYYAEDGLSPVLQFSCPRGEFAVSMFIASSGLEPEAWRLDAGGEAARIDMLPTTQPAQGQSAAVDQGLSIINALAVQGQTFTMTAPGGQRLQFPTHPGISRVLDACRFASQE